ncbi:MAG: hypothetical protein KJ622_08195 [Alphaproteobacteria bacterium]|nr:hypothetical protein [Alphaproteobacteria bacterium]
MLRSIVIAASALIAVTFTPLPAMATPATSVAAKLSAAIGDAPDGVTDVRYRGGRYYRYGGRRHSGYGRRHRGHYRYRGSRSYGRYFGGGYPYYSRYSYGGYRPYRRSYGYGGYRYGGRHW